MTIAGQAVKVCGACRADRAQRTTWPAAISAHFVAILQLVVTAGAGSARAPPAGAVGTRFACAAVVTQTAKVTTAIDSRLSAVQNAVVASNAGTIKTMAARAISVLAARSCCHSNGEGASPGSFTRCPRRLWIAADWHCGAHGIVSPSSCCRTGLNRCRTAQQTDRAAYAAAAVNPRLRRVLDAVSAYFRREGISANGHPRNDAVVRRAGITSGNVR